MCRKYSNPNLKNVLFVKISNLIDISSLKMFVEIIPSNESVVLDSKTGCVFGIKLLVSSTGQCQVDIKNTSTTGHFGTKLEQLPHIQQCFLVRVIRLFSSSDFIYSSEPSVPSNTGGLAVHRVEMFA